MSRMIPILEIVEYENDKEAMNSQLLAPQTLSMIKTLLATDTLRLNELCPDPESYSKFIQDHAVISGAIAAWKHLINNHEEVIRRLAVD